MQIATILTCFNRKEKTLRCLDSLYRALDHYNGLAEEKIELSVYLTDDGCTDGTGDAVRELMQGRDLHIIQGDGNLYWAGGMRAAWREALKEQEKWSFYFLINDDVEFMDNVFAELMEGVDYAAQKYGKPALVSGITVDKAHPEVVTYGGMKVTNFFLGLGHRVPVTGTPQECDKTHANILLVSASVVDKLGIFHEGYQHAAADYDYSMMARRKGFPILTTSHPCGYCEFDHDSHRESEEKLLRMTLKQRKAYFANPVYSTKDYLLGIRRMAPARYPFVWCGRMLNLYCPKVYYWLSHLRGEY